MARSLPYRSKAPSNWEDMVERTCNSTLFLVQETGPTCFVLKDNTNLDVKYKVSIGDIQSCSCRQKELCIHIMFVMLKVLRVPPTNPIAWQVSLVDQEVVDALAMRTVVVAPGRLRASENPPQSKKQANSTIKSSEVEQKPIEDVCPICHDDMIEEEPLSYCKRRLVD
jgi:E3 ubiquitin-protein ligase ZSWIM2